METEGHNGYIVETINPDDEEYDDYIAKHFNDIPDIDYFSITPDDLPIFLRRQGD